MRLVPSYRGTDGYAYGEERTQSDAVSGDYRASIVALRECSESLGPWMQHIPLSFWDTLGEIDPAGLLCPDFAASTQLDLTP